MGIACMVHCITFEADRHMAEADKRGGGGGGEGPVSEVWRAISWTREVV